MTAIEICNLALGYLASSPITTFADGTTAAKLCSAFYRPTKKALLEGRNWTFAKRFWSVTPGTAPTDTVVWVGSYAVPATCLRVHRVDEGNGTYRIGWERVGANIYTDTAPATLYVEGIGATEDDTTDEAGFSQAFCFALAAALAAEICIPLTENATLWAARAQLAEKKLKDAAGSDGSQGKSEQVRSDSIKQRR